MRVGILVMTYHFAVFTLTHTPVISSSQNVICYFSNWANHRSGDGHFVPENLDASLCSHVFYAYASLDPESFEVVPSSKRIDIDSGYYNRVQGTARRQNPAVQVFVSIGGWTDSAGDTYSQLVSSPDKIKIFSREAAKFVEERGFDGLSVEWQYPVCWQSDCNAGRKTDRLDSHQTCTPEGVTCSITQTFFAGMDSQN